MQIEIKEKIKMEKLLENIYGVLKKLELDYAETYVANGHVFYVDAKDDTIKISFAKICEKDKLDAAVEELCNLLTNHDYHCEVTVETKNCINMAEIIGVYKKKGE